jgi:predicted AlkP superfamily pyrophosphatase or phosphodiesterase
LKSIKAFSTLFGSLAIVQALGLIITAHLALVGCQTSAILNVPTSAPEPKMLTYGVPIENAKSKYDKPYVVLVSIDGYRWDYNRTFSPPNLLELAHEGVVADSMKSVYPSKTVPNHYSIITGTYPDRHGMVSSQFYDPIRKEYYALSDPKSIADGSWCLETPLWTEVENQGLRTASFFWVGAEGNIKGSHPNSYYQYDESVSVEMRVAKTLEWLRTPLATRPHFITLYFFEVDKAAHIFGPGSREMKEAIRKVDDAIGQLRTGLQASGLPVNLIVVSDHGMTQVDPAKLALLDQSPEASEVLSHFIVLGRGPQMQLYLKDGEQPAMIEVTKAILEREAGSEPHFHVRRRSEMKSRHYSHLPRMGDLIIDPDFPWLVGLKSSPPSLIGGNHGWDPKEKEMQGVFMAVGPAFKSHAHLPTFENIHVFPLVLKTLGLMIPKGLDGKLSATASSLRGDANAFIPQNGNEGRK